MPLGIYIAKDSHGKNWAPDYPHEVAALEWMLKKAWEEFHHLPEYYAIAANLRYPSADLAVVTERGFGVLELKHKFGKVSIRSDGWYAGNSYIESGIHSNPRVQVQNYAKELRQKLLQWFLPPELRRDSQRWDECKFQTGVCFTNSKADIREIADMAAQRRMEPVVVWESDFSIIAPVDFTSWIRKLRFQAGIAPPKYEPIQLLPRTIDTMLSKEMKLVEWREMKAAMPTANVWGYLFLEGADENQIFHLTDDESTLGRNPDCNISIPTRFTNAGRKHCVIKRGIDGINLVDLGSANGTFVNQQRTKSPCLLTHGDRITLGGNKDDKRTCHLRFELREHAEIVLPPTAHESQSFQS